MPCPKGGIMSRRGTPAASRSASRHVLLSRMAAAAMAAWCLLSPNPAAPGTPAGYAEYLIPFDEDVFVYVTDPLVQATTDPIPANYTTHSLIALTTWCNDNRLRRPLGKRLHVSIPTTPTPPRTRSTTMTSAQTLNFESAAIPRPRTGATATPTSAPRATALPSPRPRPPCSGNTAQLLLRRPRLHLMVVGGATTLTRGGWINSPFAAPDLGRARGDRRGGLPARPAARSSTSCPSGRMPPARTRTSA